MAKQINLTETLGQLNDIAEWFEQQTQVDVEEGLKKVKEAATLIKASKTRLKEIENEFIEIKADIQATDLNLEKTEGEIEFEQTNASVEESVSEEISDDVPF